MNILARIFGSSENTKTIVDGAVAGLDKLVFTKEERAEMDDKARDWFLRYLEATQPQNLARRFIALVVVGLWATLILAGICAWWVSQAFSMFVFKVLAEVVAMPFSIIIGFYFAAHVLRAYKKGVDS